MFSLLIPKKDDQRVEWGLRGCENVVGPLAQRLECGLLILYTTLRPFE